MHPLFLTIGNIQSDIRMQATSHAWRCVAFIPSPEFEVPQDLRTLLLARIFHWSLDIVTASLKVAAKEGGPMVDPMGKIRNCYTPLVSYIADLPEQQLIACVSRNASPVTLVELPQFGDPTPAAPRTCEHTLSLILELCKKTDPWDIDHFQKAAKALKLLGIHLPFFRNWKFSDPSLFLTGEVLHTGHKFFFDHILSWCKTLAGPHILNTHFSNLHHRVSFCHFSSGVSRPLQMTGRDHRDIERTIVPILADVGNVTDEFIYAIRAIVEFIYRAQDPVHTDSSINAMEQALADFHARKQVIIDLKAQKGKNAVINHFNIPKLKLMNSFGRQTRANGPLIQYTADVSERLLIMHCKTTFQRTSRNSRTFVDQVVKILNHKETMRLFDLYIILQQAENSVEKAVDIELEEVTTMDPTLEFIQQVAPDKEYMFRGPRPYRNYFQNPKSFISSLGDVALHITVRPDHSTLSVLDMQVLYKLLDLPSHIAHYIGTLENTLQWWNAGGNISTWNKFRIQLHSSFCSRFVDKSQIVQAYLPSDEHPLGYCDAVLIRRPNDENIHGMMQKFSLLKP